MALGLPQAGPSRDWHRQAYEEAVRQGEQIMGLPVLNFKFLPDRCHWGRNSESLQPEKEEVAGVGVATPH